MNERLTSAKRTELEATHCADDLVDRVGSLRERAGEGYNAGCGAHGLNVTLHPHAVDRLAERGATEQEVIATVQEGERFEAKFERTGFRRNFSYGRVWRGKRYDTKQVEAYAVEEGGAWVVITFVTKFF